MLYFHLDGPGLIAQKGQVFRVQRSRNYDTAWLGYFTKELCSNRISWMYSLSNLGRFLGYENRFVGIKHLIASCMISGFRKSRGLSAPGMTTEDVLNILRGRK